MERWSDSYRGKTVFHYSITPISQHIIPLRLVLEQNLAQ
jgi:hypothetical protein